MKCTYSFLYNESCSRRRDNCPSSDENPNIENPGSILASSVGAIFVIVATSPTRTATTSASVAFKFFIELASGRLILIGFAVASYAFAGTDVGSIGTNVHFANMEVV